MKYTLICKHNNIMFTTIKSDNLDKLKIMQSIVDKYYKQANQYNEKENDRMKSIFGIDGWY